MNYKYLGRSLGFIWLSWFFINKRNPTFKYFIKVADNNYCMQSPSWIVQICTIIIRGFWKTTISISKWWIHSFQFYAWNIRKRINQYDIVYWEASCLDANWAYPKGKSQRGCEILTWNDHIIRYCQWLLSNNG